MFTYFHCYHPDTWDAQIKAGFIDEHAGVRFMQTATLPEGTRNAEVRLKNGQELTVLESSGNVSFENGRYNIEINPGEWFLAKL